MKVSQTPSSQVQSTETSQTSKAAQAAKAKRAAAAKDAQAASASSASSADVNASISPRAKEMATAKAVASDAPDVREEKIAELKRRIAEGRYKVDSGAIADKMVDEHLSAGIG